MNQALEIQELAIVITAKDYDPSLMNPGFLKYSDIIPNDWQLAKKPIVSSRGSQIVFNNGIYIVTEANRLMFVESLTAKDDISKAEIPHIARRYTELLRNIQYQAIGINFRGYTTCINTTVEDNNYLIDNFIQPGEWQNCGTEPVKAGLNLVFPFEDRHLSLSVSEAGLKMPEAEQVPIVLFSGNFNYDLISEESNNVLGDLESIINNWEEDLNTYKDVVNKFSNKQTIAKKGKEKEPVAV